MFNTVLLGRKFNVIELGNLKSQIQCLTEYGKWTFQNFTKAESYYEEYHKHSPCMTYGRSNICRHAAGGNITNYFWQTNSTQCNQLVEPFSLHTLCNMKRRGNLMIVGDSMNEQIFTAVRNAVASDPHKQEEQTCNFLDNGYKQYKIQCAREQQSFTVTGMRVMYVLVQYSK